MQRPLTDTNAEILKVAEQFVRTRGYNGFSFGDVAEAVGTTRASIHYYYPTKEDLGRALVEATRTQVEKVIDDCSAANSIDQLQQYFDIFVQSIDGNLVCLCGMLMAEEGSLPTMLREANTELVTFQLGWIAEVLESGRTSGQIDFVGPAADEANDIFSLVQGAHIVARLRNDRRSFVTAMDKLLTRLKKH